MSHFRTTLLADTDLSILVTISHEVSEHPAVFTVLYRAMKVTDDVARNAAQLVA